jgi:pilus assembly protein CpaC
MRFVHRAVLVASLSACAYGVFVAGEHPALAQKKETHDEIGLAVGETKTLSAAGVKEYSEGVKGVVDVVTTPDGTRFILTGRKPGTTTLLLIKNDGSQAVYDITVATRSPQVVEREVQQLLEGVVGVRVRRIGGRIFIEGGVSTENDQKRVQQIASLYPGQVESLVIIGSAAERKLLVRLDFFFVQYEKTSSYAVGLGWPDAIGGTANQAQVFQNSYTYDFVARTTTSAQASIVNQPLPRLDIASRHGWAKIAKQSSVITANGNEATFQSGGEQNFLQAVNLTTTLVSVKFGTNVTVLPRYDSNSKDLEIKVVADVADLTPPASGTVPGRTTTKLETQVTLRLGQALVLSGIKTATQRRDVQGLPGLSEIPVLGLLFGSHRQEKAEVEGAVFIVPSVVDTVPKSALELINNAMSTYKEYSGEIEYVDAYPKAPPSAK